MNKSSFRFINSNRTLEQEPNYWKIVIKPSKEQHNQFPFVIYLKMGSVPLMWPEIHKRAQAKYGYNYSYGINDILSFDNYSLNKVYLDPNLVVV